MLGSTVRLTQEMSAMFTALPRVQNGAISLGRTIFRLLCSTRGSSWKTLTYLDYVQLLVPPTESEPPTRCETFLVAFLRGACKGGSWTPAALPALPILETLATACLEGQCPRNTLSFLMLIIKHIISPLITKLRNWPTAHHPEWLIPSCVSPPRKDLHGLAPQAPHWLNLRTFHLAVSLGRISVIPGYTDNVSNSNLLLNFPLDCLFQVSW